MNCQEVRQHWDLYYDSEGESELYFQINEHLAQCPKCAEWFHQQSHLEELIVEKIQSLSPPAPTPELWKSVLASSGLEARVPAKRWYFFGGALALAAALLFAVSLGLWSSPAPDLASLSVALHDKFASGRENPKFASTSHLEIEDYLKRHVSFPVRCPPREDAGFQARGGGTGTLANDPVAYVIGNVDGEDVSLLILSRDSIAHFPEQQSRLRGEGMHCVRYGDLDVVMTQFDQNLVLVVGKAPPHKLERLLHAYGSYPHGQHTEAGRMRTL